MRRLEVVYNEDAASDLDQIFLYVLDLSQSVDVAFGFVERMKKRCDRIGSAPHGGRPRSDLEPGLRIVPFEHTAVIAYRVEDDAVIITNVFYGGKDYETLYRSDDD